MAEHDPTDNKRPLPDGDDEEAQARKRRSKWDQTAPSNPGEGSVLGADVLADIAAKAASAMSGAIGNSAAMDMARAMAGMGGGGGGGGGGETVVMELKASAVGGLIGKGGQTITGLRTNSGASIEIEKEGDPRRVTITGAAHSVATAKQMVEEVLVREFGSVDAAMGNGPRVSNPHAAGLLAMMGGQLPGAQLEEKMPIPRNMVGRCIGKGGAKIRELSDQSGAQLSIDQNVPDGQPAIITFTGAAECIEKCKQLVFEVINRDSNMPPMGGGGMSVPMAGMGGMPMAGGLTMGMPQMGGAPSGPQTEVAVPLGNCVFGKIIGKGGETIRNLKSTSGVDSIQLVQDAPGGPICKITGSEGACQIAAQMVAAIVSDDPSAAGLYGQNSAPRHGGGGGGGGMGMPMANPGGMFAPPMGYQQPGMQPGMQPMMQMPQQGGLPAYMMQGMPQQQQQMGGLPAYMMQGQQMMQQPQQMAAPAMPEMTPTAPGSDWSIVADPTSGRNYYWNAKTQQSSWEAPPEGM